MIKRVWILVAIILVGMGGGALSAPDGSPEVAEFLNTLFIRRAEALKTGAPAPQLEELYAKGATGALAHENGRISYMQAWAAARTLTITGAKSELTNLRIQTRGDTATVSVIVRTAISYQYNGDVATNQMGVGSWHWLQLSKSGDQWQVVKDYYLDALGSEWSEPYTTKPDAPPLPPAPPPFPASGLSEKRADAVKYAETFCGSAWGCGNQADYNTKFRTYRNMGGDCANFASQVLTEGGGLKPDWTWRAAGKPREGSAQWLNAQAFTNYLVNSGRAQLLARGTYPAVHKALARLQPGDVVAYQSKGEITHVAVVTGRDAAGVPVVAAHTADRFRNPWDLGWNRTTVFWLVHLNY